MDVDTTREVLRAAFRSSSELQGLLATLKKRSAPDEYKVYARRIATAIDTIGDALINSALAEHPELRSEIDDRIAKE
ncbi:MAG: hypothetical protein WB868_03230, partial [Xanthobacteraceae bacterium]